MSYKVLVISKTFHPPWATGATAFTKGLLQSILATNEVEVTLLSTTRPRSYVYEVIPREVLESYKDEFVNLSHMLNKVVYLEERKKNRMVSKISIIKKARQLIKKGHFHLIHELYGLNPNELALLINKLPIVRHVIIPNIRFRNILFRKIFASFPISKLYTAFSSNFVAKTYQANLSKLDEYEFIIPPAINTEVYSPVDVDVIEDGFDYRVLYIGPVTPDRFPPQVLKALALLNSRLEAKVGLRIVTTPWRRYIELSYIKYLKNLVSKFNLDRNIEIVFKTLTLEEKLSILNGYDVFIQIFSGVPRSVVPVDPPITLLEAMACGKAVVTSKCMSMPRLIRQGFNGYLVSRLDEEHIANVMDKALLNKKRVGSHARETVIEEFSLDKVSSLIKSMYELIFS